MEGTIQMEFATLGIGGEVYSNCLDRDREIAEGEGEVGFRLEDIPLGLPVEEPTGTIYNAAGLAVLYP